MYPCRIIRSGLAITARIMVDIVADITAVLGIMEGTTAALATMEDTTAVLDIMALTTAVLASTEDTIVVQDTIHQVFTIIIVTDCIPVYITTMAIDRMGAILITGAITDTAVKTIMYKTIISFLQMKTVAARMNTCIKNLMYLTMAMSTVQIQTHTSFNMEKTTAIY